MARSAEAQALENLAVSVMRALGELPEAFKTVVYLADVHGYHYAEIAELMGTPVGTVMSRIYRGRQMLRTRLTGTAGREGTDGSPRARRGTASRQGRGRRGSRQASSRQGERAAGRPASRCAPPARRARPAPRP